MKASRDRSSGTSSTRAGCKGDPRMNRAVAARLLDPSMSLSQALHIGGFSYPSTDDAAVTDDEMVTLGQRKNQLNRRLRMARKPPAANHSNKRGNVCRGVATNIQQAPPEGNGQIDNIMLQFPFNTINSIPQQQFEATRNGEGEIGDGECKQNAYLVAGSSLSETLLSECLGKASAAVSSLPGVASRRSSERSPLLESLPTLGRAGVMTASQPQPQPQPKGTVQLNGFEAATGPNMENSFATATTSGAFSSFSLMAKTNNEHHDHAMADEAGPMNTRQSPQQGGTPLDTAKVTEHETALQLFQKALPELYKNCMLRAGFDIEETKELSQRYRQFTFEAWQNECERLQVVLSCVHNDDCSCSSEAMRTVLKDHNNTDG